MRGLLDTNIIIYISKGSLDIASLFEKYDQLLISRITQMEVLGFDFQNSEEKQLIKQFLSAFPILEITQKVAEVTIETRKSKRIKLPDAIIYATALVNNCSSVTANEKDFRGIKGDV